MKRAGKSFCGLILTISLGVSVLAGTSTFAQTRATNTPYNNVQETSIVGYTNASGAEVTTTAYMQYYNSSSSDTAIYTVTKVGATLYNNVAAPFIGSGGDPVLAVDPFVGRTYLAGVEYGTQYSTQGILNVWYSDNGGQSGWNRVTVGSSTQYKYWDKTSVAVSWHSGTRGTVYASALTPGRIRVYRSTDGGQSYTEPSAPNSGVAVSGWVQSPILSVDPNTGYVYLFWIDWTNSRIRVARSTQMGASFVEMQSLQLTAGTLLIPQYDIFCTASGNTTCDNLCSNDDYYCVKADSMFALRFNMFSNTFGVVWHQRNTTDNRTDVYFAYYSPSNFWSTPSRVNSVTTGDQWHPALDWDNSGNYLVTYYDRRDNPTYNFWYRMYATKLTAWGNRIGSDTLVTTDSSNVANLRLAASSPSRNIYTLGEYHDVWFWNGHWTLSYIFAPYPYTDEVYLSVVNP